MARFHLEFLVQAQILQIHQVWWLGEIHLLQQGDFLLLCHTQQLFAQAHAHIKHHDNGTEYLQRQLLH